MTTVLIVIHLMAVLAMIGLVLLQRSEGGALGMGGGSGNFMSSRGAGNVLTRSTAVLAGVFFLTSIGLSLLARYESRPSDILDRVGAPGAPALPAEGTPGAPGTSVLDVLRQQSGVPSGPQTPPAAGAGGPQSPAAPAEAPAPAAPPASDAAPAPAAPAPAP